jgi:hypothetical protein
LAAVNAGLTTQANAPDQEHNVSHVHPRRRRNAMSNSETVDALVLDLLEWIGPQQRPYAEVMDAWRTSCPRLPVWEEANARGFLAHKHHDGAGNFISVSPAGRAHLSAHRQHTHCR